MSFKKILLVFLSLLLILSPLAIAHSGKTDGDGGHHDRISGGYHYHHGYSAHQHPDGVCPYGDEYNTKKTFNSGDVIGIVILVAIIIGIVILFNFRSVAAWWEINQYRDSLLGIFLYALSIVFKLLRFLANVLFCVFAGLMLLFTCLGIPAMIVMAFIEALEAPTIGFIIFVCCAILFIVTIASSMIYDKLYGDAKRTTQRLSIKINLIREHYLVFFNATENTSRTGLRDDARKIYSEATKITEILSEIKELYSGQELDKYISEDERSMIFKKIDAEIQHLNILRNEIDKKYFGKSRLVLPNADTHTTTKTDIAFFMLKCRRQGSKGRYSECPAKIQRTKTTIITTLATGERIKHTEAVEYTVMDFYFKNNNERKPVLNNEYNLFEEFDQKNFLTTTKEGKTDKFEVVLTGIDATSEYRTHQIIDTARKVAKDATLTEQVKKAVKGLKISFIPPKTDK